MDEEPLHIKKQPFTGYPEPDIPVDEAWSKMTAMLDDSPKNGTARSNSRYKIIISTCITVLVGTMVFWGWNKAPQKILGLHKSKPALTPVIKPDVRNRSGNQANYPGLGSSIATTDRDSNHVATMLDRQKHEITMGKDPLQSPLPGNRDKASPPIIARNKKSLGTADDGSIKNNDPDLTGTTEKGSFSVDAKPASDSMIAVQRQKKHGQYNSGDKVTTNATTNDSYSLDTNPLAQANNRKNKINNNKSVDLMLGKPQKGGHEYDGPNKLSVNLARENKSNGPEKGSPYPNGSNESGAGTKRGANGHTKGSDEGHISDKGRKNDLVVTAMDKLDVISNTIREALPIFTYNSSSRATSLGIDTCRANMIDLDLLSGKPTSRMPYIGANSPSIKGIKGEKRGGIKNGVYLRDKLGFGLEWNAAVPLNGTGYYWTGTDSKTRPLDPLVPNIWTAYKLGKNNYIRLSFMPFQNSDVGKKILSSTVGPVSQTDTNTITKSSYLLKTSGIGIGLDYGFGIGGKVAFAFGIRYSSQSRALMNRQAVRTPSGPVLSDSIVGIGKSSAEWQYIRPFWIGGKVEIIYGPTKVLSIGSSIVLPLSGLSNTTPTITPLDARLFIRVKIF